MARAYFVKMGYEPAFKQTTTGAVTVPSLGTPHPNSKTPLTIPRNPDEFSDGSRTVAKSFSWPGITLLYYRPARSTEAADSSADSDSFEYMQDSVYVAALFSIPSFQ
ncbi:hypothetical protein Clacol_004275 [Clathrus columnatus]|uniref:Uncharacterized protein n=1 Tax=Clathrus columnatus TaxID=1419009 RepID=A0AAV5A605_9AGAM|nr:hypothetical protein Clacol_004275 [Clathrus columnatus]